VDKKEEDGKKIYQCDTTLYKIDWKDCERKKKNRFTWVDMTSF